MAAPPGKGRPAGRLASALAQGRSLEGTDAQHRRPSLEVVALIHSSCA